MSALCLTMSDNPSSFVLNALFGASSQFFNGVLQQVDQINETSVGSISVAEATRFIQNQESHN